MAVGHSEALCPRCSSHPSGRCKRFHRPLDPGARGEARCSKTWGLPQVGSEGGPFTSRPALPHHEQLHHILTAERPTVSAEPELSPELLVLHSGSGIYHRRPERSSVRTACGWSFADSGVAVEVPDSSARPHGWFQLCCRCWPKARAMAKADGKPMALCDAVA